MPAKKKPAPKAPAKTAKKAAAQPASKTPVKTAKPAPKPPAKTPAKPVKKAAQPAPKKSPPVKKAPAKPASKPVPKKAAAKPAPAKKEAPAKPAPAKKAAPAAPAKKAPVKAAAPAKKAAEKAAPAVKEVVKAATPAPAPKAAAPAPKAPAKAPAPAVSKSKPAPAVKITNVRRMGRLEDEGITMEGGQKKPVLPAAFLKMQRKRLVELRDAYLSSAEGVASESLRNNDGNESAFGMHQADAGSDAYDRDFALSLLAKEQDAIYEINEALKRVDTGAYGICEMSGDLIPEERLEALPFTRFTVGCQERIEREQRGGRWNRPVRSLFGLDESAEDGDDDRDEDETTTTTGNSNESLDFSKE